MEKSYISLIVSKKSAKIVKNALEENKQLDRSMKIRPFLSPIDKISDPMIIPTTIEAKVYIALAPTKEERVKEILLSLHLEHLLNRVSIYGAPRTNRDELATKETTNSFTQSVKSYLVAAPQDQLEAVGTSIETLLAKLPSTYSIYPPLLLLPSHTFTAPAWQQLLSTPHQDLAQNLYQTISRCMNITHIALNAPIPAQSPASSSENILRSPTHLSPLYGDFGPLIASLHPTQDDFNKAFWVSAKQNGITQIWAPRYSMFSRGNITEKARVLELPSVKDAVEQGELDGRGFAAVDLYAGIGYFAFSYAKAGVAKVLCWELNSWSVEGLRRGAASNRWGANVFDENEVAALADGERMVKDEAAKFLVYRMDNSKAVEIVERLRRELPPVRHVNCGLLPSSQLSWETAIRVLDPELGGWIHLHENIAVGDIPSKAEEVVKEIQQLVDNRSRKGEEKQDRGHVAVLEHVQRVKTYAPGVMHCVLDICIMPVIMKN